MSPLESLIKESNLTKYQFGKKFGFNPYNKNNIKIDRIISFAIALNIPKMDFKMFDCEISIEFKKVNDIEVADKFNINYKLP